MSPRWVVGGDFHAAGTTLANSIVAFDPATGAWQPLGSGLNFGCWAVTTLPNGGLVVGGYFGEAGSLPANSVAAWNGAGWSAMGNGLPGGVTSLVTLSNGDVVAAGGFTVAAGAGADRVARWNGAAWVPVGGSPAGLVLAMAAAPSGELIVAGSFSSVAGVAASNLARWNGTTWSALGGGVAAVVSALAFLPNGDLLAGTDTEVRRWNGSTWQAFGPPLQGNVRCLTPLPTGDVVAAGDFAMAGGLVGVARGNGGAWTPLGSGVPGQVKQVTAWSTGELLVAGGFGDAGGVPVASLARWQNGAWSALATGFAGPGLATLARCAAELPNGDLVVGGNFTGAGGVPAQRIARWDGGSWSPLAGGLGASAPDRSVWALAVSTAGVLFAGGDFTMAGGVPAPGIARFDGTGWSSLGAGLGGQGAMATTLASLANGDLLVGGYFGSAGGVTCNSIARWDGSGWSALGNGLLYNGTLGSAYAIVVLDNGDLLVGGVFTTAGGVAAPALARWNGTTWSPFGGASGGFVTALARSAEGRIWVARSALSGGYEVAEWVGGNWATIGFTWSYPVQALLPLPDGDLLVGGRFTDFGGVGVAGIARWNGSTWSAVDGPLLNTYGLHARPDGEVVAVGNFVIAGSQISPLVARLAATCPAIAVSVGSGCVGAAGPVALVADTLPWLGSTWLTRATGVPANAFAVRVFGLGALQVPLASFLPQGGSGCDLLTTPDVLEVALPSAGVVTTALPLPNTPALVGGSLRHQVVPFELDPVGNFLRVTATNSLLATIGSF